MALPKLKVLTLTDAAANRVRDIIAKAERPIAGVRVGVKNGGCAGMSYTMEYAEAANAGEDVVEDKGVKVFIDPKAVLFLLGTEMDFQTTKLTSQFVFNNPNQTSACGCGESVAITPAAGPDALAAR
ncbi:MAG TPA: Fe-S cluster assembly scaffold SufA [Beijerinckiaceae bacterium]|jgi:iron-sulfur cluster assembly protein